MCARTAGEAGAAASEGLLPPPRPRAQVPDWRAATNVEGFEPSAAAQLPGWLWQAVEAMDESQRRRLLRFWTGLSHLPAGGFARLVSGAPAAGRRLRFLPGPPCRPPPRPPPAALSRPLPPPPQPSRRLTNCPSWAPRPHPQGDRLLLTCGSEATGGAPLLPKAHTCFRQLVLPRGYRSFEQLQQGLLLALEHADHFAEA